MQSRFANATLFLVVTASTFAVGGCTQLPPGGADTTAPDSVDDITGGDDSAGADDSAGGDDTTGADDSAGTAEDTGDDVDILPPAEEDEPDPSTARFAVFQDPDSDFSTIDVRDIDEEFVRFDPSAARLIWVEDGSEFAGWSVSGNFLGSGQDFQVRFGTKAGERRAYFTETGPATICDIYIEFDRLRIRATNFTVPNE